jgi:hypothetical protein
LRKLLKSVRAANAKLDITGLLLHRQNCFFQVLEGHKSAVQGLYRKIRQDNRHQRCELLFEGDVEKREFTDWRMGFVQLDEIDAAQLPGFTDYLENYTRPRELFSELSKTQRLMVMFRSMI